MDNEDLYRDIAARCTRDMRNGGGRSAAWRLQDELHRLERDEARGLVRPRTILLIGGGGYAGTVMARHLLARGYRVRVLDNFIYGHGLSVEGLYDEPGFELVHGDMRDDATLHCGRSD